MNYGKIIEFFDNKKSTIFTILAAVIVWSLGRGYMQQDTAQLITDIMVALGFTANYVTSQYWKGKDQDAN